MKKIMLITSLMFTMPAFADNLESHGEFTTTPDKTVICYSFDGSVNSNTTINLMSKNTRLAVFQHQPNDTWLLLAEKRTGDTGSTTIDNIDKGDKDLKIKMEYSGLTSPSPYKLQIQNASPTSKGRGPDLNPTGC